MLRRLSIRPLYAARAVACRPISSSSTVSQATPPPASAAPAAQVDSSNIFQTSTRKAKSEGTIADVFATLSGGTKKTALEPRFATLKQEIIERYKKENLVLGWKDVLRRLEPSVQQVVKEGTAVIPVVEYNPSSNWLDEATIQKIKKSGAVVVKNVIPQEQALQWKKDIRDYVKSNPSVKGFPADDPQVYELYWTKSQLAARSHPRFLDASKKFLSLWSSTLTPTEAKSVDPSRLVSFETPITYADRLRIRQPGDTSFSLGPHIDGGGVERWEDPTFQNFWSKILSGNGTSFDSWSLGEKNERLAAKGDLYDCPGACSVFRPYQGWVSMSSTGAGEGTLKVLPMLKELTEYIILRPFFTPINNDQSDPTYLQASNWELNSTSTDFPGCTPGQTIELSPETHPHLRLEKTMLPIPRVDPGDLVLWHTDLPHAVESVHGGASDSSVMYIPVVPLTVGNAEYLRDMRENWKAGIPPNDFPGGVGESKFLNRITFEKGKYIMRGSDKLGSRAMGVDAFVIDSASSEEEKRVKEIANQILL